MLRKITFEVETVTPMFLSGADQGKAELRAASIKGLLRFWWRALQAESNIDDLREKESQLFGSSDEKRGGSCFSIRINNESNSQPATNRLPDKDIHKVSFWSQKQNRQITINILEYLAYGPFDPRTKKIRPYIDAKTKFKLILHFRDNHYIDDVLKAMYIFSLFGGLGSRSRNGFGSFTISKQEGDGPSLYDIGFVTDAHSTDSLRKLVNYNSPVQPYSSFSHGAKIFRCNQSMNSWDDALSDVGKTYRGIRVGDKKINETVFEPRHKFDKRQYLGAPLDPYQENFKSFLDRHAKPYFIKVAKEGNKYRSYILYLPSQYCIGLEKDRNGRQINHSTVNSEFLKICNEFNGFLAQHMEPIL